MRAVIWVLTAGFGDGHNTAARCVDEAIQERQPGVEVEVVDWIAKVHPWAGRLAMQGYAWLIVHAPWVWKGAYDWFAKDAEKALNHPLLRYLMDEMGRELSRQKPEVVVSTYPLYASLLGVLRKEGHRVPRLITVVTDSVSIHPTWVAGWSDLYLVADAESREVLIRMGITPDRVQVTGFPVSPAFTRPVDRCPSGAGRVLYLPSTGRPHVAETLAALEPMVRAGVELTIVTGRHEQRLHQTMRRFADRMESVHGLAILGWCSRVPDLLREHDVIICKAGGAMLHEVMAGCRPAVVDCIVPGQEEGNAQMLLAVNGGVVSNSPTETVDAVRRLLADDARLARDMADSMRKHSLPDAAFRVADVVSIILSPGSGE